MPKPREFRVSFCIKINFGSVSGINVNISTAKSCEIM
jgi:hypothetical protein